MFIFLIAVLASGRKLFSSLPLMPFLGSIVLRHRSDFSASVSFFLSWKKETLHVRPSVLFSQVQILHTHLHSLAIQPTSYLIHFSSHCAPFISLFYLSLIYNVSVYCPLSIFRPSVRSFAKYIFSCPPTYLLVWNRLCLPLPLLTGVFEHHHSLYSKPKVVIVLKKYKYPFKVCYVMRLATRGLTPLKIVSLRRPQGVHIYNSILLKQRRRKNIHPYIECMAYFEI